MAAMVDSAPASVCQRYSWGYPFQGECVNVCPRTSLHIEQPRTYTPFTHQITWLLQHDMVPPSIVLPATCILRLLICNLNLLYPSNNPANCTIILKHPPLNNQPLTPSSSEVQVQVHWTGPCYQEEHTRSILE